MYIASNVTPAEELRLTGTLRVEAIEALIERDAACESMDGIDGYISEARAQFPAEDFLSEIIESLHALAKNVRGANKDAALKIISDLDDIAQCTFNAADYGRDELEKAIESYKDAQP